jgi:putative membrane protein
MRGYGDWCWWPGNWFGGGMFIVLISVLLIFLLVALIRRTGGKSSSHEEALDILKRRYAAGEIGKEQFDNMKREILD